MNIALKQGQWTEKKKELNAQNARCQKCLELGHWTFQCKGKRKNIHRSTRSSLLKKRLKAHESVCQDQTILKAEKEISELNSKNKKKKKDNSDDKMEDSDSDSSLSHSSSSSLSSTSDSSDSTDLSSSTTTTSSSSSSSSSNNNSSSSSSSTSTSTSTCTSTSSSSLSAKDLAYNVKNTEK